MKIQIPIIPNMLSVPGLYLASESSTSCGSGHLKMDIRDKNKWTDPIILWRGIIFIDVKWTRGNTWQNITTEVLKVLLKLSVFSLNVLNSCLIFNIFLLFTCGYNPIW